MTAPVNLNAARKTRARAEAKRQADANAAKFGRTKAERLREAKQIARSRAALEAHRSDDDA